MERKLLEDESEGSVIKVSLHKSIQSVKQKFRRSIHEPSEVQYASKSHLEFSPESLKPVRRSSLRQFLSVLTTQRSTEKCNVSENGEIFSMATLEPAENFGMAEKSALLHEFDSWRENSVDEIVQENPLHHRDDVEHSAAQAGVSIPKRFSLKPTDTTPSSDDEFKRAIELKF